MIIPQIEKLKYPIGPFVCPNEITSTTLHAWINSIRDFSNKIETLTSNLSVDELNYQYRPDGWNVKQLVHHCADSHLNSLIRFKWALTEDNPTIKSYNEVKWAELPDSLNNDISYSIELIRGLHSRWVYLLVNLSEEQLLQTFTHPDTNKTISLKENIGAYAWHCNHHLEHIRLALRFKNQFSKKRE